MRDMVFIVWGGNHDLAEQVCETLKNRNIDAQVGGHDDGPDDKEYYLGDQILGQMKKASQAIILAQADTRANTNDQVNKSSPNEQANRDTYRLRPNLMFEWGYLWRSLPAECVHVFLKV